VFEEVAMQQTRGQQEAARLEKAASDFVARIQQVPQELLTKAPEPGEWTLMELAAHSAEIYPFWAKQIVWLKDHAGQPFGRTASDPDRIKFVEDHKTDPLNDLVVLIQEGAAEGAAALRSYSADEWSRVTGIHAARGEMTMDAIANLFLAGHAEEHLHQFDETLEKVKA
jgi:hypothetical protein